MEQRLRRLLGPVRSGVRVAGGSPPVPWSRSP
jgi:hypothetical protein